MRFRSRAFWLAKDAEYECQDAFDLDAERGIAAIADGVATAIFSGSWARILAQATVADPPNLEDGGKFQAWLNGRRATWWGQIDIENIPWNLRPLMVDGAMSTLLWVELFSPDPDHDSLPDGYRMRSVAIGDCCLFHVRQNEILRSFPMGSAGEFDLNPAVIGSVDRKDDHLLEFQVIEGDCWPGDLLVLSTDAVAQWAIRRWEVGDPVNWEDYWDMSGEDWRQQILTLRREKRMRYDDATLVLLDVVDETAVPAGAEWPLPAEVESPPACEAESPPPIEAECSPAVEKGAEWAADGEPEPESATESPAEGEPEPRPVTEPTNRDDSNEMP